MAEGHSGKAGYNGSPGSYEISELTGKLYGKVTYMTHKYGLIKPFRRLPPPYKKKTVFFHVSKVEGPKVARKDILCFKLNLQSHDKPNATWVKVNSPEDSDTDNEDVSDDTDLEDYTDSEEKGPYCVFCGTVVKINKSFGFVKPDEILPAPFLPGEKVYFKTPEGTKEFVKKGCSALFTLNIPTTARPAVETIEFFPEECTLVRHPACGHIALKEPGGSLALCMQLCSKKLSCGHECSKPCREVCPDQCSLCESDEKKKIKVFYTLQDLKGLLYGTVVDVEKDFGVIKPEYELPPPLYHPGQEVHFWINFQENAEIGEGDQVVFELIKDKHLTNNVTVIEDGYDNIKSTPCIRPQCGHICFMLSSSTEIDCNKACSETLPCGHPCSRKCSEPCRSTCYKCIQIMSKGRSFLSASYAHDIVMGHISHVGDGFVHVKPSTPLPQKYKQQAQFIFLFDNDEQVEQGQQAVCALGQGRTGEPCIWKLAVLIQDDYRTMREVKKRVATPAEDNPVERLEVEAANNTSNLILRYKLLPKRHLSINDPKDLNYRIAESHFLRLAVKSGKQYEIESIKYYVNPVLVRQFRAKRNQFERKYGKRQESRDVLAFHGTDSQNISNIIRENFQLDYCQRSMYGKGIYLSEFPHVSIDYGSRLLLCKVLPGRSHDVTHTRVDMRLRAGYDSHRVRADEDGYGWALVIDDPDQYIYKFK